MGGWLDLPYRRGDDQGQRREEEEGKIGDASHGVKPLFLVNNALFVLGKVGGLTELLDFRGWWMGR